MIYGKQKFVQTCFIFFSFQERYVASLMPLQRTITAWKVKLNSAEKL